MLVYKCDVKGCEEDTEVGGDGTMGDPVVPSDPDWYVLFIETSDRGTREVSGIRYYCPEHSKPLVDAKAVLDG